MFGPELAERFGFQAFARTDGLAELWVPNSERFTNTILKINKYLHSIDQEPIAYATQSTGFVTSREMLEMSIKGSEDIDLVFPYADRHSQLSTHEVGYHLGFAIPKIVLQQAKSINIWTLELIKILEGYHGDPMIKEIVEQIAHDRALELDIGTGNATVGITKIRRGETGEHASISFLAECFDFLADPAFKASELVALRLLRSISLDGSPEYRQILAGRKPPRLVRNEGANVRRVPSERLRRFVLSTALPVLQNMSKALNDQPLPKNQTEIVTEMLENFDQRIELFRKAF